MTISNKRLNELNCVLGFDCSNYQKNINWSKAKNAGIKFAFVKITEGHTNNESDLYNVKNRILEAQNNDIKIGYYHFARPGNINPPEEDAIKEVNNILTQINILPKANLPLVLDIEAYSTNMVWNDKIDHMNKFIATFISELAKHDISVIIYSYKSFIDNNANHKFGTYPLWLAGYPNNPEKTLPQIPLGWKEWKIWQFTDSGKIDGYIGNIDLNIMKKDYFDLF